MKRSVRKNTTSRIIFGAGIALAVLLCALTFFALHRTADAITGSGRLVTIHDRGDEKVLLTDAASIR